MTTKQARHQVSTSKIKKNLIATFGEVCFRCGSEATIELDHILPLWKGGTNELSNFQLLCWDCHQTKTKEEMIEYRKLHPVILVVNGVEMPAKGKG